MKRKFWKSRNNKLGVVLLIVGVIMAFLLKASFTEWTLFTLGVAGGMGFSMKYDKVLEAKNGNNQTGNSQGNGVVAGDK